MRRRTRIKIGKSFLVPILLKVVATKRRRIAALAGDSARCRECRAKAWLR